MKKTHSIRGIILDVDGVIIGDKEGYNSPAPHVDVLAALKKIRYICVFQLDEENLTYISWGAYCGHAPIFSRDRPYASRT